MGYQDLIDYIRNQLSQHISREHIVEQLQTNGWRQEEIDRAFAECEPMHQEIDSKVLEPLDILDVKNGPAKDIALPHTNQSVTISEPASLPQQTAAQPTTTSPSHASSRKRVLMLVIGIVALLVVGGAVFAAYTWYHSPLRMTKSVVSNLSSLNSFTYVLEVTPQFNTSVKLFPFLQQEIEKGTITISGATDAHDAAHTKGAMAVQMNMSEGNTNTSQVYTIETRTIDTAFYAKLSTSESLPLLQTIKDQWVSIDMKQLEKMLVGSKLPSSVFNASNQKLSEEEVKQLRSAFTRYPFIVLGKKINSETVQGVETNHYSVHMDTEQLIQFVQEIKTLLVKRTIGDDAYYSSLFPDQVRSFQQPTVEVWVGKQDKQLYQISYVMSVSHENVSSISMVMQLWNHNQPITVEAPADAISIQQMLTKYYFGQLALPNNTEQNVTIPTPTPTPIPQETPSVTDLTKEENIDSDADGLMNAEEETYGTDPLDVDTDDDGYSDGAEVKGGYNPNGSGKL
ncbi:MAG TPA: hypothetical protein VJB65_02640 [Patescibacteria group bacterium]|nr:hypothetical protein [Patescibacteria group bacterium]